MIRKQRLCHDSLFKSKEELYTCVLLKCGFSIRVIESVGEVYSKIIQRTYNSTI